MARIDLTLAAYDGLPVVVSIKRARRYSAGTGATMFKDGWHPELIARWVEL